MGPLLLVLMWPEELQSVFKEAVKLLCFEFGLFQYEHKHLKFQCVQLFIFNITINLIYWNLSDYKLHINIFTYFMHLCFD